MELCNKQKRKKNNRIKELNEKEHPSAHTTIYTSENLLKKKTNLKTVPQRNSKAYATAFNYLKKKKNETIFEYLLYICICMFVLVFSWIFKHIILYTINVNLHGLV